MKKPVRPANGFPWEQPGYSFSISWPPGYEQEQAEPQLKTNDLLAAAGIRGGAGLARAQVTKHMRAGGLSSITPGRGTLGQLSPSPADVVKRDKLRRGTL